MNDPAPINTARHFVPAAWKTFHLSGYEVAGRSIDLRYELRGLDGASIMFREAVEFDGPARPGTESAVVFAAELLHQVAGVSYFKTAAPPVIRAPDARIAKERARFLEMLYSHGLAEFAAENGIEVEPSFVGAAQGMAPVMRAPVPAGCSVLLPFGGGKDSLLSLQLLEESGFEPTLFVVGPNPVAEALAERTGRPLLRCRRTLDPSLGHLNSNGALNGHVPVTAVVSALAVVAAVRGGHAAVVMSNEASADSGTEIGGREVNHQWSKSLVFEELFRGELGRAGLPVDYFSLLRPHSELAVCRAFAERGRHLDSFVSCNRNFRRDRSSAEASWCLKCPKCLFVHLCLAPFVDSQTLTAVFGGNPLADPANLEGYADLLELDGRHRPFECVGPSDEVRAAFELLRQSGHADGLPAMAQHEANRRTVDTPRFFEAADDHLIPPGFPRVLDAH